MGQWGNTLNFRRGETYITVMSHVDTGGAFIPLFDSSSGTRKAIGKIDELFLDDISGDQAVAQTMIGELRERFVGKPYQDWLDAERRANAIPL